MAPLTMENIADAVLAAGLASRAELDRLVHELYEFARDPDTVIGGPRVVATARCARLDRITAVDQSQWHERKAFANILSASASRR